MLVNNENLTTIWFDDNKSSITNNRSKTFYRHEQLKIVNSIKFRRSRICN